MNDLPDKLQRKLDDRNASNALRKLGTQNGLVDFSSNDYLGFSKSEALFEATHHYLTRKPVRPKLELQDLDYYREIIHCMLFWRQCFPNSMIVRMHWSSIPAMMPIWGSFPVVPQRGDLIFYDEYSHASIRDGITMSNAKSYKFKHNDLDALKTLVLRHSEFPSKSKQTTYIVTESVFSMDGDTPDLKAFADFCTRNNYHLIVDEAHAIGVFGEKGNGLVQELKMEQRPFARIATFGKAMGCHGAAILGSSSLKQYLINFSRSFIYTTALSPHALATIKSSYSELLKTSKIEKLHQNISFFKTEVQRLQLARLFINSNSSIHCCVVSGNETIKEIAKKLKTNGFDVKPILSPTVPKGQERLRFCLHSYNSEKEISEVLTLLSTFV